MLLWVIKTVMKMITMKNEISLTDSPKIGRRENWTISAFKCLSKINNSRGKKKKKEKKRKCLSETNNSRERKKKKRKKEEKS